MDISKEYIEMCEKAQEIQESKKHYHLGDLFFYNRFDEVCAVSDIDINEGCILPKLVFVDDFIIGGDWVEEKELSELVWTPRQDQLQEIVLGKCNYFGFPLDSHLAPVLTNNIYAFQKVIMEDFEESYDTLEKYWLAFLMYQVYNKFWDRVVKGWIRYNKQ